MEQLEPGEHLLREVQEYWREYLPRTYRQLQESGKLQDFLKRLLEQAREREMRLRLQGLDLSGAREVAWQALFPPSEEELREEAEELKERFPEG